MSFYPKKISEKFHAAKNVGKVSNSNAAGTSATFVCGAILRLTLRIETDTKEILDARFQTNGCGFVIASAAILTEKIIGKRLNELHGLDKQNLQSEIEGELGTIEIHRRHCFDLTFDALQNSFAAFRTSQIEEFSGERALICTCFGVSEDAIENLIKEKSLETVEEITDICNAGGGCGSCQPLIQEIIDQLWREGI